MTDSLFSFLRQVRVFPPRDLASDAELVSDLRPREGFVGAQLLIRVMKSVVFDTVDMDGVLSALHDRGFDHSVDLGASFSKLCKAIEGVSRPRERVYSRGFSHCHHMMTQEVCVVK